MQDYRKKLEQYQKRELPVDLGADWREGQNKMWGILGHFIVGLIVLWGLLLVGLDPVY